MHIWHSVSFSISLLQLVRQIIVKENLGLRKKKKRKISEFAQSTSRSPKQYLREEAKVKIKLNDNKKFQERRNTF